MISCGWVGKEAVGSVREGEAVDVARSGEELVGMLLSLLVSGRLPSISLVFSARASHTDLAVHAKDL